MKPFRKIALSLLLISQSIGYADNSQCLQSAVDEMNDLYRTGCGCDDGVFNGISSSMLGWGIGLFVGIALLTGLVHQSHGATTSSSSN